MKLSASQAAKKTGKSVPTITRAIKSGKLSAEKSGSGGYLIDAAELFRVFKAVTDDPNVRGDTLGHETVARYPDLDDTQPHRDRTLTAKIEALEALLERERAAVEELRADRDAWRQQATALLAAPPSKRQWWPWSRKG